LTGMAAPGEGGPGRGNREFTEGSLRTRKQQEGVTGRGLCCVSVLSCGESAVSNGAAGYDAA